MLQEFEELEPKQQDELLAVLRAAYASPADNSYCERLGCSLTAPCTVDTCALHCESKKYMNCMYVFRNVEGDPDINLHQLAGITDDTEHGVRVRLTNALTKIRREALRQRIRSEDVNRFSYVYGTKICPTCGTRITRLHANPALIYKGMEWCSRDCRIEKPEWILAAEHRYGTDIVTVLFHVYRMFSKLLTISQILGARKKPLLALYQDHFRIMPMSFGIEAMDACDILRNTTPTNTWGFGTTITEQIQHLRLRRILDRTASLVDAL